LFGQLGGGQDNRPALKGAFRTSCCTRNHAALISHQEARREEEEGGGRRGPLRGTPARPAGPAAPDSSRQSDSWSRGHPATALLIRVRTAPTSAPWRPPAARRDAVHAAPATPGAQAVHR
jgi:hypothetical protein